MSQKAYMWNGNNSFAYSDPSGYYTFGGYWTTDQEKEFEQAAQAADQQVTAAMKDYKKDSKEYKALAALHHDLQRGTAGWTVSTGSLPHANEQGATEVSTNNSTSEATFRITGVGGTTIDPSHISSLADYVGTIVTEGGIYESASGRAGEDIKSEFADAMFSDMGVSWDGEKQTDRMEDLVANEYFNKPACVQLDY